eukprot:1157977-Pelagomonas_calceolata.AAC.1
MGSIGGRVGPGWVRMSGECFTTGAFLRGATAAGAFCPSCIGQAHVQRQWQVKGKVVAYFRLSVWPHKHEKNRKIYVGTGTLPTSIRKLYHPPTKFRLGSIAGREKKQAWQHDTTRLKRKHWSLRTTTAGRVKHSQPANQGKPCPAVSC